MKGMTFPWFLCSFLHSITSLHSLRRMRAHFGSALAWQPNEINFKDMLRVCSLRMSRLAPALCPKSEGTLLQFSVETRVAPILGDSSRKKTTKTTGVFRRRRIAGSPSRAMPCWRPRRSKATAARRKMSMRCVKRGIPPKKGSGFRSERLCEPGLNEANTHNISVFFLLVSL